MASPQAAIAESTPLPTEAAKLESRAFTSSSGKRVESEIESKVTPWRSNSSILGFKPFPSPLARKRKMAHETSKPPRQAAAEAYHAKHISPMLIVTGV